MTDEETGMVRWERATPTPGWGGPLSPCQDDSGTSSSQIDVDTAAELRGKERGCCGTLFNEVCLGACDEQDVHGRLDVDACFCANAEKPVFVAKLVGWALTLSTLVARLTAVKRPGFFVVAYLTQWGLLMALFYQTLSCLLSSGLCRYGPPAGHCFVVRIAWVAFSVAAVTEMLVSAVFWLAVYPVGTHELDYPMIMEHGVIFFVLIADGLVINRVPVRARHWLYTCLLLIAFTCWTIFHSFEIREDPKGEKEVLYDLLDWKNAREDSLLRALVIVFVISPLFHAIIMLFSMFRRRYDDNAVSDSNSGPTTIVQPQEKCPCS